MTARTEPHSADYQIISENCMEIGNDLYLLKADRPGNITMFFVYRAGDASATHITTEKMEDSCMENIREQFTNDIYYRKKLLRILRQI